MEAGYNPYRDNPKRTKCEEFIYDQGYEAGLREQGSPRADAEIRLANKEYAKKYRKAWNEDSKTIKPFKEGIREVVEWIKSHQLIEPDDNSITRFSPFYQIEKAKLKEWGME